MLVFDARKKRAVVLLKQREEKKKRVKKKRIQVSHLNYVLTRRSK